MSHGTRRTARSSLTALALLALPLLGCGRAALSEAVAQTMIDQCLNVAPGNTSSTASVTHDSRTLTVERRVPASANAPVECTITGDDLDLDDVDLDRIVYRIHAAVPAVYIRSTDAYRLEGAAMLLDATGTTVEFIEYDVSTRFRLYYFGNRQTKPAEFVKWARRRPNARTDEAMARNGLNQEWRHEEMRRAELAMMIQREENKALSFWEAVGAVGKKMAEEHRIQQQRELEAQIALSKSMSESTETQSGKSASVGSTSNGDGETGSMPRVVRGRAELDPSDTPQLAAAEGKETGGAASGAAVSGSRRASGANSEKADAATRKSENEATAARQREDREREGRERAERERAERQRADWERTVRIAAEKAAAEKAAAEYLASMLRGIHLRATKCPDGQGHYYVIGDKPSGPGRCIDVTYRARCPGTFAHSTGVAENFVGISDCFGDTYQIQPKPSCDVRDVVVSVTDVKYGCK